MLSINCYRDCIILLLRDDKEIVTMERQHSLIVKNEKSRAKRASETESEKRQRCDKRNAADRARRALKLKIEQQSSTKRQVTEENVATNFQ